MPPTPKATMGTPDPDKPFKTIEVLDARTLQVSKVACMSCIRGHRTTSCGIPVCRNKIFWTVKRPGRPSNACNCRYGAGGGCKCVVAKAQACPHKAAKGKGRGDKRGEECRCDEQGRYCCVLEEGDWKVLTALGKPKVEFYASREALEARVAAAATPRSPPQIMEFVPTTFDSIPSTPMQTMASPYTGYQSPRSVLAPRFGMMGLGAPQGSEHVITPDVLAWDGLAPMAPREQSRSCCQGPASPPAQSLTYDNFSPPPRAQNNQQMFGSAFDATFPPTTTISSPDPPSQSAFTFSMGDFMASYTAYQFPSAICQTCGLNGCTCRNCPPVMQDTTTGSWAQCCGRKHARTAAYVPATVEHAFQQPPIMPASVAATPAAASITSARSSQERHLDGVPGQSVFALSPPQQQQVMHRHVPQQQQLLPQDQAPRPYYQEQLFSAAHNNIPMYPTQPPNPQHPHAQHNNDGPWPNITSHNPSHQQLTDFMPFDPGEAFALPLANGDEHVSFMDEYLLGDLEQADADYKPGLEEQKREEEAEAAGGGCCCSGG